MKIEKLPKTKFPKSLLELPQPPEELYILGKLPEQKLKYLCVVGSRKFTSYGKEVCEKIIEGLQNYPIAIVSGFAMGIDTIAHKKALSVGLPTIVFPGSGLGEKVIYPKTNLRLIKEILNKGGCFLSEFKPDFMATNWSFPMRNRLMAGIADAVLIIEAEEKSGTLITARLAIEYNKELLTIPHSIFSQNGKGPNKLLRQGAVPITSAEDVLEVLGFENLSNQKNEKDFSDLSVEEKSIINLLFKESLPRDEIIRALKLEVSRVNTLISVMEIKGLIKEEFGEIRII